MPLVFSSFLPSVQVRGGDSPNGWIMGVFDRALMAATLSPCHYPTPQPYTPALSQIPSGGSPNGWIMGVFNSDAQAQSASSYSLAISNPSK